MILKFHASANIADCRRIRILHKGNLTDKIIISVWTNEYPAIHWTYEICVVLNCHALVNILLGCRTFSASLKGNFADFIAFIRSRLISEFIGAPHKHVRFYLHFQQNKSTLGFFSTGAEYWFEDIHFDIVTPSILNPCTGGIQVCVFSYSLSCPF
jgi:hypothetical protein